MSRRAKKIEKRVTLDPKYNSELVAHMIRVIMKDGKKTVAERIVYGAIDKVAAQMKEDTADYPVVYFKSDTTGEKAYEEFYVPGEKLDMDRFQSLGVVQQTVRHSMAEVNDFFDKLESIFTDQDFTKAQVVEAIKEFIPNFEHEEKGKNLDQKM